MPTVFVLIEVLFGEVTTVLGIFTSSEPLEAEKARLEEACTAEGSDCAYVIEEHELDRLYAQVG